MDNNYMDNIKNILKKFKIWIIAFIFGGAVLASGLGGEDEISIYNLSTEEKDKIQAEVSSIDVIAGDCVSKKTKCKQIKKYEKDGNKYETHEYKTPKGDTGYQTFIYKTVGEKEYVKSIGYGVEADGRTFDWVEVVEEEF